MTKDPYQYPQLRWPLDVRYESFDDQEAVLLRCPLGVSPEPLVLVREIGPLLACFTGQESVGEIVNKYSQYGVQVQLVSELVQLLDQYLFLQSPRYHSADRQFRTTYRELAQREAALAGGSYAGEASALKQEIGQYLALGDGLKQSALERLVCLVSPHIDYRRGHACYAKAYHYLRFDDADVYVVIGTAHQYSEYLFHLTHKDFVLPMGMLPCERGFVERLSGLYGFERSFGDEVLHKQEHSLELQLPFLYHLKGAAKIVPILVGGFHDYLSGEKQPQEYDEYESFVAALTECVREYERNGVRVCFIAGVDMAHVGGAFGDIGKLTPQYMDGIRARDEIYLRTIVEQDKDGMLNHIAEDRDARRICGFPTMYTLLDVLDRLDLNCRGQLFDYSQAVDYQTDCAVTFAGIGLYAQQR